MNGDRPSSLSGLDLGALLVPRQPQANPWDDIFAWDSTSPYSSNTTSQASTTDPSPASGPAEPSRRTAEALSTPLDTDALAASLQQWTGAGGTSAYQQQPIGGFDVDMSKTETPTPRPRSMHGVDVGFVYPQPPAIVVPHQSSYALPPLNPLQHAHLLVEANNSSGSSPSGNEGAPVRSSSLQRKQSSGKAKKAKVDDDDEANLTPEVLEDRRRRNSEASARFRSRKKERDAALAATAKALNDKVSTLEQEVERLRAENGWLRGLITEKASAS